MEQVGPRSKIALRRTLKKTAKHAQVEGSRAIRQQVNLKAAYVKSKLKIVPASANGLILKIVVPQRGRLLSRFPFTVLKKSVTVKIKPTGARSKLPDQVGCVTRAVVVASMGRCTARYCSGYSRVC
jgi:hypothetical protein